MKTGPRRRLSVRGYKEEDMKGPSGSRRTIVATFISVALFVAACSSTATPTASPAPGQATAPVPTRQNVVIGLSTQDLQNQYWLQLIDSFKAAAEPYGATVLVGTTNQDPAGQAQEVSNFLSQGAQA